MYAIADFDLTNVIHRQDGSYVAIVKCSGIPYHIASDIDDYRHLLSSFSEYVSAHPECVTEEQPYVPPVPTLEQTKAAKLSEINKAADAAIATLTATYPDREISTFDKQESEARAYAVDSTASTPLLSALA